MSTRLALLVLLYSALSAPAASLLPTNSTWRFLRGTNEASLPDTTAWRLPAFNDAAFANAPAPFWYGDTRPGGTELTDMINRYTCIFLRNSFVVTNTAEIGGLRLSYLIDDGVVMWINGIEVFRENVPANPLTTNTLAALQPIDPAPLVTTTIAAIPGLLQNGTNVIAVQVFNTSTNSSDLGFDCVLESILTETNPPTLVQVSPLPGDLTALTEITVTFSEPVTGVNADDFLINTQPAAGVSGGGATYTFLFGQPNYGHVSITWFPGHGIADTALPPNAFDGEGPGATWMYTLRDTIPPIVTGLFPSAGVTLRNFSQIEVSFGEEVNGVEAADLLINDQPATSVSRAPGGPYVFQFPEPAAGAVAVRWADGHGIADQATMPNAFGGGSWSYVLDPNALAGELVITEFVASNQSGLQDEDNQEQDWVEIFNRGGTPVNLAGWSLSDDAETPGLWVFPARVLGAGEFLVVLASGKDRRNPTGTNRLHTNFQLGGGGGFLGLFTADSPRVLASGFNPYPEQRNDHSYGPDAPGTLRYFAPPTPGAPNGVSTISGVVQPVHSSSSRGHYSQPFDLYLSCPTPGAAIRFTTDGSEPTLLNGRNYVGALRLTNTTLIRAAAFRTNLLPATVQTHTYFFNLSAGQRSIPVLSIVTATSNLFGRTGILGMGGGSRSGDGAFITNNPATDYHNPSAHGIAWERPVSAEYIDTTDNSGFQIDCGIRVQGSDWQRPRTTSGSKFSFRLYFRGDYGPGRLEYPMFPLTTVQSFDQVVLRAGFNDNSNPFIRDELTRRNSHDMGQVASHGSFVNVFTNGFYAGYYNPCERVHEEFMQSYLGGGSEWDVVGPDFAQSSEGPGVVDGDRRDFNNLLTNVWGGVLRPVTNNAKYVAISQRLELANFADYCLLNAYTAMGDWPANNWRAARERGNANALWRFVTWDAEWGHGFGDHVIGTDSFALGGTGTLDAGLNSTGNSEIARLYQALRAHPEFRLLWADRIYKHFFNGGALTSLNVTNRLQSMRAQLQTLFAISDVEFLTWNQARLPTLFAQFNTYGLFGFSNALHGVFASSNAPVLNRHGGRVAPGFSLTMSAPQGGAIYYTTNGDDPRVPFSGAVSNAAAAYTGPITLTRSLPLKARTLRNGTNWSALADVSFAVGTLGIPLRITEVHYNPADAQYHEFIELMNGGGAPVDLSGMSFDGISYLFNLGTTLAPGARLVLASSVNPSAFAMRYPGVIVFGFFAGGLANGGERIALKDTAGNVITSVDYDDAAGWAAAADGAGASLELVDPYGDPDDPANWRASATAGGTPGTGPTLPPLGDVRLNEVLADNAGAVNHAGTFPDFVELHNAGGDPVNLTGWSLTDDGNPRKFVFPGTMLDAGGHLTVWCDDSTNTTPGLHSGFAFGRNGDNVFLYDANTNLVDALTFGLQWPNYSVGRIAEAWTLTVPTTNAVNVAAATGPVSSLSVNEVLANPGPGDDDWVELFNASALPVALRGAFLASTTAVHQITSLSFVGPFGFVQFFADEGVGPDHVDFRLPAAGGAVVLYDAAGTELNRLTYTNQAQGVARGRLPDGSVTIVNFPGSSSPGSTNYVVTYSGPVLNEVLARNVAAVTNAGRVADFVELFNPNATSFTLAGMSLSLGTAEAQPWVFPPGASIPGRGYLVLWCDEDRPASTNAGDFNTGRALAGESGGAYLFNSAGQSVNAVEYGFQIPDGSIGLISNVWRLTSVPTPGASNPVAAPLGSNSAVRINEWMARPAAGAGWFELCNTSNLPVDLAGLVLTDDPSTAGTNEFRIAPLSFIGPGGFVQWIADSHPELGRHQVNFDLDADGESIRLYGTNGVTVIDTVAFPAQRLGVSQGRLPDGAPAFTSFVGSPTPGQSNYRVPAGVVFNELLPHPDVPGGDAIELHNPTGEDAFLGGWYLSDSAGALKKYRIADGTVLSAGGFLVFGEAQFNSGLMPFALDRARGGELWLSAAEPGGVLTGWRTRAQFGAAASGVSIGRHVGPEVTEYVPLSARTLPGANAAPLVGPVVLHEIMYHPFEGVPGVTEFIELRNLSGAAVDMFDPAQPANRWRLAGGIDFTFPPGTNLAAGATVLIVDFDPVAEPATLEAFREEYGVGPDVPVFGPYAGRLDNAGETVELQRPDLPDGTFVPFVTVDRVSYRDAAPWPADGVDGGGLSLQRREAGAYGNDPGNWVAGVPTPGAANNAGVVVPPTITQSPASVEMAVGSDVLFQANASGAGPLRIQWRFSGIDLPGETNASLRIEFVRLEDDGMYDAYVSNPGGPVFTAPARLTVIAPPVLLLAPPPFATLAGGSNITFTVAVAGAEPLRYQWTFNTTNLLASTGPSLLITNAGLSHSGIYSVTVSNRFGATNASVTLVVLVRPVVTLHPVSTTVRQGDDAVFAVASAGTMPMSYRWRRAGVTVTNGLVLSTPTNSVYIVTNAQAGDQLSYTVVVTNLAGQATISPPPATPAMLFVLADTDHDGLPDSWEMGHPGFDLNNPADGAADADLDGMSNGAEFLAGTDYLDPASKLRVDIAAGSGAILTFFAQTNRTYTVEYTDHLSPLDWRKLADVFARTNARLETILDPGPGAERYYRLVTPIRR